MKLSEQNDETGYLLIDWRITDPVPAEYLLLSPSDQEISGSTPR